MNEPNKGWEIELEETFGFGGIDGKTYLLPNASNLKSFIRKAIHEAEVRGGEAVRNAVAQEDRTYCGDLPCGYCAMYTTCIDRADQALSRIRENI